MRAVPLCCQVHHVAADRLELGADLCHERLQRRRYLLHVQECDHTNVRPDVYAGLSALWCLNRINYCYFKYYNIVISVLFYRYYFLCHCMFDNSNYDTRLRLWGFKPHFVIKIH
jgi:hypothetical protein